MTGQLEPRTLTDEERGKFLDIVRKDPKVGNVAALRAAGIQGTKGELRRLLDDDLAEAAREARGWSLVAVEQTTWDVAQNPEHPAWDRANARVLKAYHPAYRDQAQLEVTGSGGGPIQLEGRRVVSLGEVIELAQQLGIGLPGGDGGDSRLALPRPPDVLSDPQ